MAAPIKVYNESQTGAPQISGEVGKLVDLLDACLVNGYNSQVPTAISVTSNVVTVTAAAHGYNLGDVIQLSGVTDKTELNAEWRIESAVAGSFTFTSSTSTDGAAAGTFATKIAPLGWEKSFSGTNKAAYRSSDISSSRQYLQVIDDVITTAAQVNSYEGMSSVDVGIGPMYTPAHYWKKSYTADATARNWILIGDSKRFWFFNIAREDATYKGYFYNFFGDLIPDNSGDKWFSVLAAASSNQSYSYQSYSFLNAQNNYGTWDGVQASRAYDGFTPAAHIICHAHISPRGDLKASLVGPQWSEGSANGALLVMPVRAYDVTFNIYRGWWPGLYASEIPISGFNPSFVDRQLFTAGSKTLIKVRAGSGSNMPADPNNNYYSGSIFFDVIGPWD